jgi:hypothetical protein
MVNPNIAQVDKFLDDNAKLLPSLWAMQIMGSGVINLDDALQKVLNKNKFSGILYATTKKERVAELFNKV